MTRNDKGGSFPLSSARPETTVSMIQKHLHNSDPTPKKRKRFDQIENNRFEFRPTHTGDFELVPN